MVSVHAENDAMLAWTARRLLERGHTRAALPRDQPSAHRRGRGGQPPDRHGRAGRPAGRGRSTSRPKARWRRSATPRPAARRCSPRPARSICCSRPPTSTSRGSRAPSGCSARRRATRGPRGDLARRRGTAPSRWSPPTTRPIASTTPASSRKGPDPDLQADRERHPRHRAAPAAPVLRGRGQGPDRPPALRRARAAPTRRRSTACIPGRARSRSASDADLAIWDPDRTVEITDATTHDATGYCPYAGMTRDRLAGHRDRARRGDRARGRAPGRARPRPLPAARRRRGGKAGRAAGSRDGPGAQLRRRADRLSGRRSECEALDRRAARCPMSPRREQLLKPSQERSQGCAETPRLCFVVEFRVRSALATGAARHGVRAIAVRGVVGARAVSAGGRSLALPGLARCRLLARLGRGGRALGHRSGRRHGRGARLLRCSQRSAECAGI